MNRKPSKELLDKTVYRLCGEDVVSVLKDMGLNHFSEAEVEEIVGFVKEKMEIPWTEYVEVTISTCLKDKEFNCQGY